MFGWLEQVMCSEHCVMFGRCMSCDSTLFVGIFILSSVQDLEQFFTVRFDWLKNRNDGSN